MKLIIAGGRNYQFEFSDYAKLDAIHSATPITQVVSGGASGADHHGEVWAKSNRIPIRRFLPDWKGLGKAAGPQRNSEMAKYAQALAVFPGGSGTRDMIAKATTGKLKIFDCRPE